MPESSDVVASLQQAPADRYRLERKLGAGGMATVYLALDLKHQRQVAIKLLRPDLAAALGAERFLAEIRTPATLQHRNIVPLFDSGAADGLVYYVMPYIAGESLLGRLVREARLDVPTTVAIARGVAQALASAHEAGVVHRGIKPPNVLLSLGHALVAEFGIARAVKLAGAEQLTATLLSLRFVLYELLTGEPPFTGATVEAVLVKRFTEVAPSVRTRRSEVPEPVAAAFAKALAQECRRPDRLRREAGPGVSHGRYSGARRRRTYPRRGQHRRPPVRQPERRAYA